MGAARVNRRRRGALANSLLGYRRQAPDVTSTPGVDDGRTDGIVAARVRSMLTRPTSVKLRRFERGLLQMEVARRAAIGCTRLSQIENGQIEPQPDELARIAAVLNVAPADLLAGSDTPLDA